MRLAVFSVCREMSLENQYFFFNIANAAHDHLAQFGRDWATYQRGLTCWMLVLWTIFPWIRTSENLSLRMELFFDCSFTSVGLSVQHREVYVRYSEKCIWLGSEDDVTYFHVTRMFFFFFLTLRRVVSLKFSLNRGFPYSPHFRAVL